MISEKIWIIAAGIIGFTGVAIGAFGAHGLQGKIPKELLEVFKTGVQYHLIQAVMIGAIAVTGENKFFISALFFMIGIFLFSFSLYIYSTTAQSFFAMITPFGGVSFLIGWIMLLVKGMKD